MFVCVLLMCGGLVIVDQLVKLFEIVWKDGCLVRDWCNTLIVPAATSDCVIISEGSAYWIIQERFWAESSKKG